MRKNKKILCALLVAMFIVFSAITGAAWEIKRIDPTLPPGMIPWGIPGNVIESFYPPGYTSGFMTTYSMPAIPVAPQDSGIIGYWVFQYNLWDSYCNPYHTFLEMDEGDRAIFQPGAIGKLYD